MPDKPAKMEVRIVKTYQSIDPAELERRVIEKVLTKEAEVGEMLIEDGNGWATNPQRRVIQLPELILDRDLRVAYGGTVGPGEYNLIVVDGTLEIPEGRRIVTAQNLAIRARLIKGNKGRIDIVSGSDGTDGVPWESEKASDGPDGPNPGANGGKGRDARTIGSGADDGGPGGTGDHGQRGQDGQDGRNAHDGADASHLSIVTDSFDRECWLIIQATGGVGGTGSNGQSGGDGGDGNRGGNGGKGGKASLTHTAGRGGPAGAGGDAGGGGSAGRGGNAGSGGRGGNISALYTQSFRLPKLLEMFNEGGVPGLSGRPGTPGAPGRPGQPGTPGPGGDGSSGHSGGAAGGTNTLGREASPGAGAAPGISGSIGQEGTRRGAAWAPSPPIWPYAALLNEDDWKEILGV